MKTAGRQLIIKGVLLTLAICCAWAVGNGPLSQLGSSDFAGDIVYAEPDEYELSYVGNKPLSASTQLSGSMEPEAQQYNEEITLPDCGYTLPGYAFRGWSVKPAAESGDKIYRPGDQIKGTDLSDERGGAVKLYAQWEPLRYVIELDSGDANQGAKYQSAVFDEPGTLSLNDWYYVPYTFHGWTDGTTDGTIESFYGDGAEFCNLCSMNADGSITGKTLTAEWVGEGAMAIAVTRDGRPVSGLQEEIHFSDGGADFYYQFEFERGSYVLDPVEGLPGGSNYRLTINDPDYAELPEGKGSFYFGNEGVSVVLEYNTVQIAKGDDNVTEVFVAESETGEQQTQMVVPDHKKLFLSASVKDKYRFTGYTAIGVAPIWGEDPTVSKQTITVTGPVKLIAHAENTYSISYDLNGGRLPDGKDNPTAYTPETKDITLVNPGKKDYDFTGWTGTGLQQPTKNVTIREGSTGDRMYKANWKLKEYKVTFVTNGGSKVAAQTVKIHKTAQKPANPKKKGYTFKGWYADKSLTKAFSFKTAIEKNTTVYAKWSANPVPVLLAQGKPSGKTGVRIFWNKVPGTSKYLVYAAGDGSAAKRIKAASGTSFTVKKFIGKKGKWTKLKPHRVYKFIVVAVGKNGSVLARSKAFHVITANTMNKYANIKTIKANKKTVTLKKGKTLKLGAKYTLPKGRKHINKDNGKYLRFTSNNPKVVSVDSKGMIKAKDTGKATIYIQDTCGKYCKTVVTVK